MGTGTASDHGGQASTYCPRAPSLVSMAFEITVVYLQTWIQAGTRQDADGGAIVGRRWQQRIIIRIKKKRFQKKELKKRKMEMGPLL